MQITPHTGWTGVPTLPDSWRPWLLGAYFRASNAPGEPPISAKPRRPLSAIRRSPPTARCLSCQKAKHRPDGSWATA